ncbi:hypothetical protein ABZ319_11260 [Nocardia sp. NPDC005978]|uniref:hypothetical protein n=1 Tax=Nocardia sp. NPDC005978 TaxID=3156725 RepID=UPI0033AF6655
MSQSPPPNYYGPDGSTTAPSIKSVADCRDVYEFLDDLVRPRPLMWVRGGSLRELETMLFGYSVALQMHSVSEEFAFGPNGPFCRWLFKEFRWGMACGWAWAIEDNLAEGETAMDSFFRLLDQYRGVSGAQQSSGL